MSSVDTRWNPDMASTSCAEHQDYIRREREARTRAFYDPSGLKDQCDCVIGSTSTTLGVTNTCTASYSGSDQKRIFGYGDLPTTASTKTYQTSISWSHNAAISEFINTYILYGPEYPYYTAGEQSYWDACDGALTELPNNGVTTTQL